MLVESGSAATGGRCVYTGGVFSRRAGTAHEAAEPIGAVMVEVDVTDRSAKRPVVVPTLLCVSETNQIPVQVLIL